MLCPLGPALSSSFFRGTYPFTGTYLSLSIESSSDSLPVPPPPKTTLQITVRAPRLVSKASSDAVGGGIGCGGMGGRVSEWVRG